MRKSVITKVEDQTEGATCSTKKCGGLWHKFVWLIILVAIVVVGYYGWSAIKGLKPSLDLSANQDQVAQAAAQKEILAVVAKVKRLMVLPDNELPQMLEIRDATLAAKEQPFYIGSQNGDKLLIYVSTGKAIIYSPARDLIVNVGPIKMDDTTNKETNPAPASTTPKKK